MKTAFQSDGVVKLPGFLSIDLCAAMSLDWERVQMALRGLPTELKLERRARFVTGTLPPRLDSLPYSASLMTLAESVCGGPARVYMNRLLLKDTHANAAVSIHQDLPYFDGGNKLSLFIPLADAVFDDAPLVFVRGSHQFGVLPRGTVLREKFPPMADVCFEWELGDVIAMDFLTWHFSCKSESGRPRPALQIVYEAANGDHSNSWSWLAPAIPCAIADPTEPDYVA